MRHNNGYRKLGRTADHRKAMLRNMATSFLTHGKIETTVPKAKELRGVVEKLITLGKKAGLAKRRQAASYLFTKESLSNVFGGLAERFKDRPGGYTRIVRLGARFGDGAEMCNIELVDYRDHEGKAAAAKKVVKTPA